MADLIINIENITLKYKKGKDDLEILNNFSIDIPRGELVGIIGQSGKGKSTLLKAVGGLKKPDQGTVRVNGRDIYTYSGKEMDAFHNNTIGFVFQDYRLISELTALENVMLPSLIAGMDKKDAEELSKEYIERYGLLSRIDHYPHEMSGGEQQRIAIARALSRKPDIILADEPTGSVDADTKTDILELLWDIHSQGTTMLIASHDESLIKHCERIIKL